MNDTLRKYFVDECDFVASSLAASPEDPAAAVYYFSAIYASAQRVINIEFSSEMMLVHVVTHWVHQVLNQKVATSPAMPGAPQGQLPEGLIERLGVATAELRDCIANGTDTKPVLETLAQLGYMGTGNGFYLHQTGKIP